MVEALLEEGLPPVYVAIAVEEARSAIAEICRAESLGLMATELRDRERFIIERAIERAIAATLMGEPG